MALVRTAVMFGDVRIICWNITGATVLIRLRTQGVNENDIHSVPSKQRALEDKPEVQHSSTHFLWISTLAFSAQSLRHAVCCFVSLLLYSYGSEELKRHTRKNERENQWGILKIICAWNETNWRCGVKTTLPLLKEPLQLISYNSWQFILHWSLLYPSYI